MNMLKQESPVKGLDSTQMLLDGYGDSKTVNREPVKEDDKRVHINGKGAYVYKNPFCKHCHSRKMKKHGYNTRKLYDDNGVAFQVKVQRYECKECGTHSQTEFPDEYGAYCNYSNNIKGKSCEIRKLDYVSLRNVSKIIKSIAHITLSHETIRKSIKLTNKQYYKTDESEYSGYYGYDVQWIENSKIWNYRHTIFDTVNNMPIAELIAPDEDIKTTKEFIEQTIPQHKRTAIVTDMKNGYSKIMTELGFKHQKCIFHFIKALNKLKKEFLNKTKKKIIIKLKKEHKYWTKTKTHREAEKQLKPIKEKINHEISELLEFRNKEEIIEASEYIQEIKTKSKHYTPALKNYLDANFFSCYKDFIRYKDTRNNPYLEPTNNKIENYFGKTMPKADKRKFRTKEGIFDQIYLKAKNWIEKTTN